MTASFHCCGNFPSRQMRVVCRWNRPVILVEGSGKFGLPLQNVHCPLAVKLVGLFNGSTEVVSAGFVHGNACSHSVMTPKRVYLYLLLETTPRFKQLYSKWDLVTRTLCTVYAAGGAGSD